MLNNVGIHWFNNLTVINFDGRKMYVMEPKLVYSYRLTLATLPVTTRRILRAITQPLLVVVGTSDEVFFADQFDPVISQFTKVKVMLVPNVITCTWSLTPQSDLLSRNGWKALANRTKKPHNQPIHRTLSGRLCPFGGTTTGRQIVRTLETEIEIRGTPRRCGQCSLI